MKILIVTKNWLGDVLFQIPAIELIRKYHPQAEIVCLAPKRCHEILAAHPAIDRLIIFDERKEQRSLFKRLAFIWLLRKEKWDKAYLFHRSRTRAFLLWAGGVRERIGYATKKRSFLTKTVPVPKTWMHQVDFFLELLKGDGLVSRPKATYRFYFSEPDRQSAARFLIENKVEAFVCFHLGANWEPKRWPTDSFAKLADLISEKWGLSVILTGGSEDKRLADQVLGGVKKARVISLVDETSLGELGAIFQHAAFVVSGDSGPLHIAAGVGAPVVALFGPTNAELTGPRGPGDSIVLSYVPPGCKAPCYDESERPQDWLAHIRPEKVIAVVEEREWIRPKFFGKPEVSGYRIKTNEEVRSILVVTLTNIGDVILNTAVITALAAQFPKARLTVVTSPRAKDILTGSRFIHRLVLYDKHAPLLEKLKFLLELRRENYDWVVDLKNTAIPFLVKAKKRSPLFRRFKKVHIRDRHLEVLKMMGLKTNLEPPPFDFFNAKEESVFLQKMKDKGIVSERGWILIAPVAASGLKTWRLAGFRELIEKMLRTYDKPILLTGGERERTMVESLTQLDPSRVYNFAGETTLRELAVLISRCSLLVAHDSSALHLGFEIGCPAVGIFGPTDPERSGRKGPQFRMVYEPVSCFPCEKPQCRFNRQACLEDLSSEKVFRACQELLNVSR